MFRAILTCDECDQQFSGTNYVGMWHATKIEDDARRAGWRVLPGYRAYDCYAECPDCQLKVAHNPPPAEKEGE